ncbi:aminomethyltransferase [Salsuginibacillus halophilus]|uniref:Aminomethyltransferase n=1 Tax=Salsuginibacillus halophilus TaxID=517424 RepID=A0A2P8H803_9BACI|nr:glycine cleavage system aminomethyltransferase GcvT [Salsuginibacillus halophilus]PSL42352.1 aminomethyltransferase [Salsuginibacillus halophilus]
MSELKETPLFGQHQRDGAKMVDFGGWHMPVSYAGIKEEHRAVREEAGLFDVSHMGEAIVEGKDAEALLQRVMTNDISKLAPEKAQYNLMCTETGGTVDDLLVYQLAENRYFLVLNAANTDKDVAWIQRHIQSDEDVEVNDVSSSYALIALQGPKAEAILNDLTSFDVREIKFFRFKENVDLAGVPALVSRTGYTGEDGFEIYCPAEEAEALWEALLSYGEPLGLQRAGLGARDTLRFEARLPLYGQEITANISPLEAGLGFAVKVKKETPFTGQKALAVEKEAGPARRLVGIEMLDRGIPRYGYDVYDSEGNHVGTVTSGTQSPTLEKNLGLALVDTSVAEKGTSLYVQVRKRRLEAVVTETPFYKRS